MCKTAIHFISLFLPAVCWEKTGTIENCPPGKPRKVVSYKTVHQKKEMRKPSSKRHIQSDSLINVLRQTKPKIIMKSR